MEGSRIVERRMLPGVTDGGLAPWLDELGSRLQSWRDRFDRAGVVVTGDVQSVSRVSSSSRLSDLSEDAPLRQRFIQALGVPVRCFSDLQAATWGEYCLGAGQRQDMVYLCLCDGVSAGMVANGRLLSGHNGMAGLVGQWMTPLDDGEDCVAIEDTLAGVWLSGAASAEEPGLDTQAVLRRAGQGVPWAHELLCRSAARAALLCRNLQCLLDPSVIVVGGTLGLAPGYLARMIEALGDSADELRLQLVPASLGDDACLLGVAALESAAST